MRAGNCAWPGEVARPVPGAELVRASPSDDEVDDLVAFLLRSAAQSNPCGPNGMPHLLERRGVINMVRTCMGDAAAGSKAATNLERCKQRHAALKHLHRRARRVADFDPRRAGDAVRCRARRCPRICAARATSSRRSATRCASLRIPALSRRKCSRWCYRRACRHDLSPDSRLIAGLIAGKDGDADGRRAPSRQLREEFDEILFAGGAGLVSV